MPEFDTNPIEELGFAKNAVVRVLEADGTQLPIEERRKLKLVYRELDEVQQWFYDN